MNPGLADRPAGSERFCGMQLALGIQRCQVLLEAVGKLDYPFAGQGEILVVPMDYDVLAVGAVGHWRPPFLEELGGYAAVGGYGVDGG